MSELVGIGVGPGDPRQLTLQALDALRDADRVFVPTTGDEPGRAERIVAAHVEPVRLAFAMGDADARGGRWDRAGAAIAEVVRGGGRAAFATLGDPSLYSTFSYVAQTVRGLVPDLRVRVVPGITAMQDLAARATVVLAEGAEPVALIPATADEERLREALAGDGTVVIYKAASRLERVREAIHAAGRLDGAVYGEELGLPEQAIAPAAQREGAAPYFATVIVPARRTGARGEKLR